MKEIGQGGSKNLLCRSATDHVCFYRFTHLLFSCMHVFLSWEIQDKLNIIRTIPGRSFADSRRWCGRVILQQISWWTWCPSVKESCVPLGDSMEMWKPFVCDVHSKIKFTKMPDLSDCFFVVEILRYTKWRLVPWSLSKKKVPSSKSTSYA